MPILPFYAPAAASPTIVIAGGGYAGIAALNTIYRYCPSAQITLVDPQTHHLKITHLHELLRHNGSDLRAPFSGLAERLKFRHICGALAVDEESLLQYQRDRTVSVNGDVIPFDYLLVTTGCGFARVPMSERVLGLEDISKFSATDLSRRLEALDAETPISCIGGGATGIQFFFEISHWLKTHHRANLLRLVDSEETLLPQFTIAMGQYVASRLDGPKFEYRPETSFLGQDGESMRLEEMRTGESFSVPSGLTFSFVGRQSTSPLDTNLFGQVTIDKRVMTRIFAAGDCSRYRPPGSNSMTAQSAIRKGRLSARNILRHSGRLKIMEPYLHRDLGYIISMGPHDAIGWVGLQSNIVAGSPAVLVKEMVEAQYELLLAGVDTYIL